MQPEIFTSLSENCQQARKNLEKTSGLNNQLLHRSTSRQNQSKVEEGCFTWSPAFDGVRAGDGTRNSLYRETANRAHFSSLLYTSFISADTSHLHQTPFQTQGQVLEQYNEQSPTKHPLPGQPTLPSSHHPANKQILFNCWKKETRKMLQP